MNQKDIAKLAGVSTATVSRVINNDPAVSEATAQRVRAIIEKNGYVQNAIARNLRTAKSQTVAYIAPQASPAHIRIAAQNVLHAAGYRLLHIPLPQGEQAQAEALRYALSLRMDGLLLYPECLPQADAPDYAIPLVYINAPAPAGAPAVCPDYADGMQKLFARAYQSGHRRIALLHGNLQSPVTKARYEAFLDAYACSDLPLVEEYLRGGSGDPEAEAQLCAWQFMALKEPPTAILCTDAALTRGCYQGLIDQGLSIPGDVALLSLGDFSLAPYLAPPIDAYAYSDAQIGEKAAQILLALLAEEECAEKTALISGNMEMRASCAKRA